MFGKSNGFAGAVDLSSLDGDTGFQLGGVDLFESFGSSVAAAGEVNGDGIDDLVIGAPYVNWRYVNSGESYVVFGKFTGGGAELDVVAQVTTFWPCVMLTSTPHVAWSAAAARTLCDWTAADTCLT